MSNNIFISFIMPAKNVSPFIHDAIQGIINQSLGNWELIIIEDHSSDDTYSNAELIASKDDRIYLHKNKGIGKVLALNYGYTFAKGKYIKCIDADDILHRKFIEYCININFDAMCHSFYAVSANLKLLGIIHMNNTFIESSYIHCLNNLLGMARCTWTIKRNIANKIFPMPNELPYEDMWFSLIIKKHSKTIKNISVPLYYYRQHSDQTYGGIYNYSEKIIKFRSKRKLKLIDVLECNIDRLIEPKSKLSINKNIYLNISNNHYKLYDIVSANISLKSKIKILLILNFPFFISFLKKMKHNKFGLINNKFTHNKFVDGLNYD